LIKKSSKLTVQVSCLFYLIDFFKEKIKSGFYCFFVSGPFWVVFFRTTLSKSHTQRVHAAKFPAYLVLCFERRRPKPNTVARLDTRVGYATDHVTRRWAN